MWKRVFLTAALACWMALPAVAAALSVTAAQVAWVSGPREDGAVAGEAITAGMAVYKLDNGTWKKAQCDGTAVEAGANNLGIALSSADASGAIMSVAIAGPAAGEGAGKGAIVTLGAGAAPAAGIIYGPGQTLGSLVPSADWTTSDKVTPFALGKGSNQVQLFRAYNALAVK